MLPGVKYCLLEKITIWGRVPPPASGALLPVRVHAHARSQQGNGFDRIGADLEGPEVEVAGGPRGAPAGIFAPGGDPAHNDGDGPVAQGRDAHIEAIADL